MRPETKTILTVDDTPANIRLLTHYLEKQGYRVITAEDGFEGFKAAIQHHPDLVLLDIMMPGTDGYEVCELLKAEEETRDIPIVFLTAKAEVEDKVRGFELGAVDYITKPFNLVEIATRVQNQLELKYLQKQNQRFLHILSDMTAVSCRSVLIDEAIGRMQKTAQKLQQIRKRLQDIDKTDKSLNLLDEVEEGIQHLTDGLENGIPSSDSNRIDIGLLLEDVLDVVDPVKDNRQVVYDRPPNLPIVEGQPSLLFQALYQLLLGMLNMKEANGTVLLKAEEAPLPKTVETIKSPAASYLRIDVGRVVALNKTDLTRKPKDTYYRYDKDARIGKFLTAAEILIRQNQGAMQVMNEEGKAIHVSVFLPVKE